MARVRKCILDQTEYKYCPHCKGVSNTETWRMIYCSENCRQIYHVQDDYKAGNITLAEAKAELDKLDTSKVESYTYFTKDTVKEILASKFTRARKADNNCE